MPHRAHVPRRPPADRAAVHPRRRRSRGERRARRAGQAAALRLRGHLRSDGRVARHHPVARPAAARVPPRRRGAARAGRARASSTTKAACLLAAAQQWREANPMLGTRGVRLGIIKPGLYRMQAKAILEAAIARKRAGGDPHVEIMIPLIVVRARARARHRLGARGRGRDVRRVRRRRGRLPRRHDGRDAARRARRRRDRRGRRVLLVRHQRPHPDDVRVLARRRRGRLHGRVPRAASCSPPTRSRPSTSEGVGQLVRMAVERGRATRPDLHLGICGEHGGDPASVAFFAEVGLDYVSCSPYRVPDRPPGRRPRRARRRRARDSTA